MFRSDDGKLHHTEDENKRIRESNIGKNSGKSPSILTRLKISMASAGKPKPEGFGKKISDIKRNGYHPTRGKHLPEEWKNKIRDSNIGKHVMSEDLKLKLISLKIGKSRSDETKKKLSESMRGEKSPNWRGGISFEPYCQLFNEEFKKRVRARYEYKCAECGMTQEENGKSLAAHHVHYDKKTCCKEGEEIGDRKFVALCKACHIATNHNREFWEDWFTEIINTFYGGQCYFPKDHCP